MGLPEPSADPLRQLDDDSLRAADVAKPIDAFVVLYLDIAAPCPEQPPTCQHLVVYEGKIRGSLMAQTAIGRWLSSGAECRAA
jgi:hypothetical protein